MKKRNLGWLVLLALLLVCLVGCKGKEKKDEIDELVEDKFERIGGEIAISEANFPDAAFRSYIEKSIDRDKNGSLSADEIRVVQTLNLDRMEISDLSGIEVFYYLSALSCENNNLTKLVLPKSRWLVAVDCSNNRLTELDTTGCRNLTSLYCSNNPLMKLNVSKNPKLVTLECMGNQLTGLNLDQNYWLARLVCTDNPLTALDVSHSDPHIVAYADGGVTIDRDYKEADNGPSIDEKNFPDEVFRHYVESVVDQDKNGILSEREMNVTRELKLNGAADLTGIRYFIALEELSCANGNLTEIDLSHNRSLIHLDCSNNRLSKLDLSKNTELEELFCTHNEFTELDVSKNRELRWFFCSYNHLKELKVDANMELVYLDCSHNQVKKMDCSQNTRLKGVDCTGNPLVSLDIRNCLWDVDVEIPRDRDVEVITPPTEADTRNAATP